jgi:hypothetical protein
MQASSRCRDNLVDSLLPLQTRNMYETWYTESLKRHRHCLLMEEQDHGPPALPDDGRVDNRKKQPDSEDVPAH